jgi:hypothetical protein
VEAEASLPSSASRVIITHPHWCQECSWSTEGLNASVPGENLNGKPFGGYRGGESGEFPGVSLGNSLLPTSFLGEEVAEHI